MAAGALCSTPQATCGAARSSNQCSGAQAYCRGANPLCSICDPLSHTAGCLLCQQSSTLALNKTCGAPSPSGAQFAAAQGSRAPVGSCAGLRHQ